VGSLVTFACVNIGDDLPNGSHLEVNNAIKLRAGDTKLASSHTEATLSASEKLLRPLRLANWLFGRPRVVPLTSNVVPFRRRPTTLVLPRCQSVLGRVSQAIGSLSELAVCLR
jgi:hypothetical protein